MQNYKPITEFVRATVLTERASPPSTSTTSGSTDRSRSPSPQPTASAPIRSTSSDRATETNLEKQSSSLQKVDAKIIQAEHAVIPGDSDKDGFIQYRAQKDSSQSDISLVEPTLRLASPGQDSSAEARESHSNKEAAAISEPSLSEQNGWPPTKRMKSVLQDTSVRSARVSVRTRTDAPTVRESFPTSESAVADTDNPDLLLSLPHCFRALRCIVKSESDCGFVLDHAIFWWWVLLHIWSCADEWWVPMAQVRSEAGEGESMPSGLLQVHGGARLSGEKAGAKVCWRSVCVDNDLWRHAQSPASSSCNGYGFHNLSCIRDAGDGLYKQRQNCRGTGPSVRQRDEHGHIQHFGLHTLPKHNAGPHWTRELQLGRGSCQANPAAWCYRSESQRLALQVLILTLWNTDACAADQHDARCSICFLRNRQAWLSYGLWFESTHGSLTASPWLGDGTKNAGWQ